MSPWSVLFVIFGLIKNPTCLSGVGLGQKAQFFRVAWSLGFSSDNGLYSRAWPKNAAGDTAFAEPNLTNRKKTFGYFQGLWENLQNGILTCFLRVEQRTRVIRIRTSKTAAVCWSNKQPEVPRAAGLSFNPHNKGKVNKMVFLLPLERQTIFRWKTTAKRRF